MGHASASALDLAVTHLNAPVGAVLSTGQLSDALKGGRLTAIQNKEAAALVCYLFAELDPQLIVRCALEIKADVSKANNLYMDTLKANAPRVPGWESAVRHLL